MKQLSSNIYNHNCKLYNKYYYSRVHNNRPKPKGSEICTQGVGENYF